MAAFVIVALIIAGVCSRRFADALLMSCGGFLVGLFVLSALIFLVGMVL